MVAGASPRTTENQMAVIPPSTRRHSEIEHKIHAAMEAEREGSRHAKDFIRLSSIGKCPRALWALRNGQPEERSPYAGPWGRTLMTFSVGHHLEGAVVEWLRIAGYEIEEHNAEGDQWTVRMKDGIGIGHLDGMIQWGRASAGEWRLLEIKTAKAKKFDELVKLESYAAWNPGYMDQVQAYMGASQDTDDVRSVGDCLVVVVCKDDSRLYTESIRFSREHYEGLVQRARVALQDEMPDRPPEMKSQYCKACKYCDVNAWCWSPMAGVEFDD